MSVDGSLGYWYRETRHSSSQHRNANGIYDNKSLGVSAYEKRRGYRYLVTIHSYFRNNVVYHSGDKSDDNGRCVSRSQDTKHY